ncbi:MAG TPA: hypothetical protein VHM25_21375 [Polyangiaceae bacterium]|jgi:hypothetical protein|nr:hypothetical protein [Polyangiaceae bacterium]
MNRTAIKTSYLASAVGTLMLLGCSAADVSPETPQQAGRPGSAGSKGLLSGLAGAASTPSAGSGGMGAGGATVTAGATSGGAATAGAATGGASGAGALPGVGGFPSGGANSFSLGGYGGDDWIRTIIENSFAGDGSIRLGTGGASSGSFQPSFGGVGGTQLWFSP